MTSAERGWRSLYSQPIIVAFCSVLNWGTKTTTKPSRMLELVVIGCLHGSHSFGVCDTIAWAGRKAGVKLSAGLDHMGPNPNCKKNAKT